MGFIYLILGLFIIGLIIQALILTWPICVPAVLAGVGWIVTSKAKDPIRSAIHSVLGPVAAGLIVVACLLALFNLMTTDSAAIGAAERAIVFVDTRVMPAVRLSSLQFVSALLVAFGLSYFLPRARVVSRFLALSKYSSRTAAAIAAAASFTFFGGSQVDRVTPGVYKQIDAALRSTEDKERVAIGQYLAARSVQRVFANHDSPPLALVRLLEAIAAIPTMSEQAKATAATYLVAQLEEDAGVATGPVAPLEDVALPHRKALSVLDQRAIAARTAADMADEAVRTAKGVSEKAFGAVPDRLKELGWSFIDKLLGERASEISKFVRPVIDKAMDKYLERYTEPILNKESAIVRSLFKPRPVVPVELQVQSCVQSTLVRMAIGETEAAQFAAREALRAADAARLTSDADVAGAEALKADHAARKATESAALARLAHDASGLSRSVSTADDVLDGVRVMTVAHEAADAVRLARIAGSAAEAARAAESAVVAARAARSAAAAADAARVARLLTVIR